MSELSEKELLLLSNYLYLDKCTEYGTINEMLDSCRSGNGWIDESKVDDLGIGGCMTRSECRRLLQEMDNASEEFKSLSLVRSIDEPELRAACFADPDIEGKATVVFRGTGGTYEAWADNVRGSYMKDTDIQKMADDFVRYDCGIFDSITVTGHSKGGNLAGYTAILNRDRVRSCLAFDPQGYGIECIRAHGLKMRDASYNIKTVSAHNDYVNSLLTQVAKENVYVENKRTDAVGRHSSYALLDACRFDENGKIINADADREFAMERLSGLIGITTALMNLLPGEGNEKVSELLASMAAAALGNDVDKEYKGERIMEAVADLSGYCLDTLGVDTGKDLCVNTVADLLFADTAGIKAAAVMFGDIHREFKEIAEKVNGIRLNLNYRSANSPAVEGRLMMLEARLEKEGKKLDDHRICLETIAGLIEEYEKSITGMMGVAGSMVPA